MAKKLNRKAVIYMPKDSSKDRVEVIKKEGAIVNLNNEDYDSAVSTASNVVKENNQILESDSWCLIQDTSWEGYEDIPVDIMIGYSTQMYEITRQLEQEKVDLTFLQSGVGSWASSVLLFMQKEWRKIPICLSVEPHSANCLYKSIEKGKRLSAKNSNLKTNMAGLDCGSVSKISWDILKPGLKGAITISDYLSERAMVLLGNPINGDPSVISGESGASGLGALIGLMESEEYSSYRNKINLNEESTVLLFNTEGDTDSQNYKRILNQDR